MAIKEKLGIYIFYLICFLIFLPDKTGWTEILRIGTIGNDSQKEIEKFLPLTRYMEKHLYPSGITRIKIVVARSISDMGARFNSQEVDLFIDSPFPALSVSCLSGTKFLLRRWKKGNADYHTIFFVHRDSPFRKLDDIMGSKIAFDEPFSTSGYFLPRVTLQELGYELVKAEKLSDSIAPDKVGYIFSNDDINTIFWVLRGYVEVGAIDNQHFFKQTGRSKKSLRIIHKTFPIPRQIVSYRDSIPSDFIERIKELLINMEHMEEGKKALERFGKTTRFDELSDNDQKRLEMLKSFLTPQCGIK